LAISIYRDLSSCSNDIAMKKVLLLLGILIYTISCSNDDSEGNTTVDLIGQWKLIATKADPGDGSGTFQNVESDKVVTFLIGGTVASNGTICYLSIESNNPTSGTYSLTESTISSSNCVATEQNIEFELVNSKLIMRYPCIEACEEKFIKIN